MKIINKKKSWSKNKFKFKTDIFYIYLLKRFICVLSAIQMLSATFFKATLYDGAKVLKRNFASLFKTALSTR